MSLDIDQDIWDSLQSAWDHILITPQLSQHLSAQPVPWSAKKMMSSLRMLQHLEPLLQHATSDSFAFLPSHRVRQVVETVEFCVNNESQMRDAWQEFETSCDNGTIRASKRQKYDYYCTDSHLSQLGAKVVETITSSPSASQMEEDTEGEEYGSGAPFKIFLTDDFLTMKNAYAYCCNTLHVPWHKLPLVDPVDGMSTTVLREIVKLFGSHLKRNQNPFILIPQAGKFTTEELYTAIEWHYQNLQNKNPSRREWRQQGRFRNNQIVLEDPHARFNARNCNRDRDRSNCHDDNNIWRSLNEVD